jgi:hypothetical protein
MDSETMGMIVGFSVTIGLFLVYRNKIPLPFFKSRKKIKSYVTRTLETDLKSLGKITIPEILERSGVPDSFYNRGSAVIELGKLCLAKRIIEEEPPGCTMRDRLARRTYQLNAHT